MRTINYESDFKIIESFKDGSPMNSAPFRFTYYTKVARGVYVAEYDRTEYNNCYLREDGKVVVPFDGHKLGLGVLNVKREFFLTDKDFSDGVCNLVSVDTTGIVLDKGATDDMADVEVEVFPFYQQGADGKSAYDLWLDEGNEGTVSDFLAFLKGPKGDKGEDGKDGKSLTYSDLTEDQKTDLASHIEIPEGSISEDKLSQEVQTKLNSTSGSDDYIADFVNGGVVNISSTGTIEAVYNKLAKGGVALCVIGDSEGNYPSTETRVNVNSKYTSSFNYLLSEDARGANVGDLLMITKRDYVLTTVCALRIIPINDAKVGNDTFVGTEGVMTPWDKERVNKVDYIQSHLIDTRNWLSSVNDTVERNLLRTRYGYGTTAGGMLKTGVCAYTPDTIAGITANWTIFVDCSSDADGGGYYHFLQTAVCRDGDNAGRIFRRMGYYKGEGEDLNFYDWNIG